MRTALTLDDDAVALVRNYAAVHSLRLGQAVSELIRCACAPPTKLVEKGEVWLNRAPPGTPKPSSQQVKDLLESFP